MPLEAWGEDICEEERGAGDAGQGAKMEERGVCKLSYCTLGTVGGGKG